MVKDYFGYVKNFFVLLRAMRIVPEFMQSAWALVDLNTEAKRWNSERSAGEDIASTNQLLDPLICQQMVEALHRRLGVAATYGGYFEWRENLWAGSYLERDRKFYHLGVDVNVAAGTAVAATQAGEVVLVDDDHDLSGGWGPRVIVRLTSGAYGGYFAIYAHLSEVAVQPGARLEPGALFARVGAPPHNGNWFPHLHVQVVEPRHFEELSKGGLAALDGYSSFDSPAVRAAYPDPTFLMGRK